jgi:putative transposase
MTYTPRILIPNCPHHVVHRGNKRETVFYGKGDYDTYLEFLGEATRRCGVRVLAYCLMPNHTHLLLTPTDETGIPRAMHMLARRFARHVNKARDSSGHLWEKRYYSAPMGEGHLRAAIRYVLSNPVRAGLASGILEWPFSSARAHLGLDASGIVSSELDEVAGDWERFLSSELVGEHCLFDELRRTPARFARSEAGTGKQVSGSSFSEAGNGKQVTGL